MIRTFTKSRLISATSNRVHDLCTTKLSGAVRRYAVCRVLTAQEAQPRPLLYTLSLSKHSRPMSSTAAMSSDASTVSLDLTAGGVTTRIHIKPSYIQKPKAVENLLKNLPALLTDATMPTAAIESFSTKGWDLDEASDTIHRYVSVEHDQIPQIRADIEAASKAENHDPHIHVDDSRMTISCTTHVPPGLSMKDVKLAKAINKILEEYNVAYYRGSDMSEADILTYRQRGREHNMEAVRQAKLACSCG